MYFDPSRPDAELRLHAPASLRHPDIELPDYAGGGLFNLAVSVARVCGADIPQGYPDLRLPGGEVAGDAWREAPLVVLFLVDGLGDEFLRANADVAPHLHADRIGDISSVFPSTTATAITTLMTAEPAAVHGLLGWFVRDAASGAVVAPLPMRHRGGEPVEDVGLVSRLLRTPAMLGRARRRAKLVTLPELAAGPYSQHHHARAALHAYRDLAGLADSVEQAARDCGEHAFIYAYTPLLDSTAHDHGIGSPQAREVLAAIDAAYARLRECLPQALIVTTADHGFIDAPPERCIDFMDYPALYASLAGPLTGERRVAYCHLRPQFAADFGARVEDVLGDALHAIPAADALAAGLFGPAPATSVLPAAGDWLLVAREDWTLVDRVPGEKSRAMIGVHGGLSRQEMRVPLVLRRPASSA